eukprot:5996608-Amphidinium_carterae.2
MAEFLDSPAVFEGGGSEFKKLQDKGIDTFGYTDEAKFIELCTRVLGENTDFGQWSAFNRFISKAQLMATMHLNY